MNNNKFMVLRKGFFTEMQTFSQNQAWYLTKRKGDSHTKKLVLSLVLVLVMVASLLPVGGAMAEGRTITLSVDSSKKGSYDPATGKGPDTYFFYSINGATPSSTSETLQKLLGATSPLTLQDGDTVVLPDGTFYYNPIVDVFKSITLKGAGEGQTFLYVLENGSSQKSRGFRIQNRSKDSVTNGTVTTITFEDFTLDGSLSPDIEAGVVLTCYNIDFTLKNVTIRNFKSAAVSAWANDTLSDGTYPTKSDNVGIKITFNNVNTENNGHTAHFDVAPYDGDTVERYGFVQLSYDAASTFNDKMPSDGVKRSDGLTYTVAGASVDNNGNAKINGSYATKSGLVTPPSSDPSSGSTSDDNTITIVDPVILPDMTDTDTAAVPQTGDATPIALLVCLLCISSASLIMMGKKRARNHR